jgi:Flp pilus assembly protein TadD
VKVRTCAAVLVFTTLLPAASPELELARKYYHSTDFAQSLRILQGIPARDAAAWELTGRNYYMQGDYKKSVEALEKAVAAEPNDSNHALWLGRAWGRRAETSSPLTAPGYASKTRQYFEKAVQLNPRNLDALSDLFEYYLEAPGIMGGGLDKAAATARQIGQLDPAQGHWAESRLASKRKDYRAEEDQLRWAAQSAPQDSGRLLDLALFLSRRGRYQEADQTFAQAERFSPENPKLLYEKAESYIQAKRNLALAAELLKRYMTLALTDEDPLLSDASKLLRQAQGK